MLELWKKGHYKRGCPEFKGSNPSNSANVAEEKDIPMILTTSTKNSKNEWVFDSGCTFHIIPDKSVLFDFEECDGTTILMGTLEKMEGMGKIKIVNPDKSITEVRYIPTMGRNLISYGQLEHNGLKYEGEDFVLT